MDFIHRNCPICGVSNLGKIYAEAHIETQKLDAYAFASRKIPENMNFRLMLCGGCGLLYADPAYSPETLALAYEDAAFDSASEAQYAARTYAQHLKRILSRIPDPKSSLDIGTGNGVFLEELLKLGFSNIAGVEPSKTPVASSSPAVRPFIKLGVFQGSDYSQNQFALVTCFQTLEHLSDPLKTCREIHRILKPGGAFYAVAHNRLSPINRLLGRYSPIFDIEHLQLFSSESLIGLLKTAGYETVECWSIRNTYPLHYWIKLFPIPRLLKTSILRFLKGSGIDQLPITLPVGNIAVVGFKSLERT